MQRLIVNVKKLNKRRLLPLQLPDPSNIVGEVLAGFSFEGEEVDPMLMPNPALGKWYTDRDGYFYWGGGVIEISPAFPTTATLEDITKKDWGFIDLKIDDIWTITQGKSCSVSVLDTGLNFDLSDFTGMSAITYFNPLLDSSDKNDCRDNDHKGHGTDCCAILCSQGETFCGVAPQIHLNVIRITDQNGQRTLPGFLKGMRKAIELQSDVVSVSFAMPKTNNNHHDIESMHKVIKEAYALNIAIVVSAGNSGEVLFPVDTYPASFPECLSIGGIKRNRTRSKFSVKSNFLDLMGPGENLHSIAQPERKINGTSFSAPFVAGVIALLKSHAKTNGKVLTNIELFDILKRGADKNISSYNTIEHGWGILDPVKSLELIAII